MSFKARFKNIKRLCLPYFNKCSTVLELEKRKSLSPIELKQDDGTVNKTESEERRSRLGVKALTNIGVPNHAQPCK